MVPKIVLQTQESLILSTTMKNILLVMADYMAFDTLIEKELRQDFNVFTLSYPLTNTKFRYKNVFQKIENIFRKTVLGDKNFKASLRSEQNNAALLEKLSTYPDTFDYALVLNVEYFNNSLLGHIKKRTQKMIAYQWDGLKRTPEIYQKIGYFDKFYCFNPSDVDQQKVFFASNFYFDIPAPVIPDSSLQDIYYLGRYLPERVQPIIPLLNALDTLKATGELIFLIDGACDDFKQEYPQNIVKCTKTPISYQENLEKTVAAKMILDLKLKEHDGLSFRFFEALHYQKKIITTNQTVKNYDFYFPENIFIFGEDDLERLEDFMANPYVALPNDILKKYQFKNWFKTIIHE